MSEYILKNNKLFNYCLDSNRDMELEEPYLSIWNLAEEYQDCRFDQGHVRIATEYAIELSEAEGADLRIVLPAIILHDIGWYFISEEDRKIALDSKHLRFNEIRRAHEIEGARKAEEILREVDYDSELSLRIVAIIRDHDTKFASDTLEEAVVKSADRIWIFSKAGFEADLTRDVGDASSLLRRLKEKLDGTYSGTGINFTDSARGIAEREFEKRKVEYE